MNAVRTWQVGQPYFVTGLLVSLEPGCWWPRERSLDRTQLRPPIQSVGEPFRIDSNAEAATAFRERLTYSHPVENPSRTTSWSGRGGDRPTDHRQTPAEGGISGSDGTRREADPGLTPPLWRGRPSFLIDPA